MKFVHTLNGRGDTIINVKTPQYIIYIVFTTPHSKNTFSLKGQPIGGCLFFYFTGNCFPVKQKPLHGDARCGV